MIWRFLLVALIGWVCGVELVAQDSERQPRGDGKIELSQLWSRGRAEGKGPVKLSYLPFREEDIGSIGPLGMMVHGHVTPSDHLGVAPKDHAAPKGHYPIVVPANGFIVDLQRPPGFPPAST